MLRVSRYHFTAKNNLRLVQMTHLRLGIGSTRNYKTAHKKPAKTRSRYWSKPKTAYKTIICLKLFELRKFVKFFLKALLQLWKPPQRNDNFTLNVQEVRWDFIGRFDCNRYSKQLVPRDLNWLLSVYRHNMQRQRWNYTAQFTTLKQSSIN